MCCVLRVALDRLRELEAVHARHLDVEQDHVGHLLGEHLQRVDAVLAPSSTAKPSRVSSRLVILRTVSESSTIITSGCVETGATGARGRSPIARSSPCGSNFGTSARCGELHRVDDQHDLAGAEHRRAGDAGHARELRPDVLHDDFLVADHLVDVDRRVVLAAAQQQDRVVALGLRVVRGVAEQPRQVVERIRAALPLDLALDVDVEQRLRLAPAAPARPSARAAPTAAPPARTSTACATASVSGSVSTNVVPLPVRRRRPRRGRRARRSRCARRPCRCRGRRSA